MLPAIRAVVNLPALAQDSEARAMAEPESTSPWAELREAAIPAYASRTVAAAAVMLATAAADTARMMAGAHTEEPVNGAEDDAGPSAATPSPLPDVGLRTGEVGSTRVRQRSAAARAAEPQ